MNFSETYILCIPAQCTFGAKEVEFLEPKNICFGGFYPDLRHRQTGRRKTKLP